MKSLRALAARFIGMFSKNRREDDFSAELESHLQMQVDDNVRAGMNPDEARRAALMKLGGLEQTKQSYRERGTLPLLDNLLHDLRYTRRQWRKNPAFVLLAVTVLAL